MTDTERNEILRTVFARAINSSPQPESDSHPIDDDDLLLDWAQGDLSRERHDELIAHLAACSSCRREVAAMIRAGVLVLPDPSAEESHAPQASRESSLPTASPWRRRKIWGLLAALAASVLLLLGHGLFDFGFSDGAKTIAMAERDLREGRAADAFSRLEEYLAHPSDRPAELRRQATAILESAGYELARRGLVEGDFGAVSEIEGRVDRRDGGSARLVNLRIQAERGETVERSLARRRSLVADYDYELDGRQVVKSFAIPEITASHRRIEAELLSAIETYPDAVDLRLNYGQFLLEQNEFARAEAVFAQAVGIAPASALAHTALGLAVLQQNGDDAADRALEHFQAAVKLSPDDPVMNMNLAVCLMRLGREADAQRYFQKATPVP